jgi:hypothetical protein
MTKRKYLRSRSLVAIATLAVALVVPAVRASADPNDLSVARASTAGFHDVNTAIAAGYGLFTDVNGIACIDNPGVGAMGIHYVNSALVGDPTENAATPEAVVYEPEPDGHLRMVAVEYVVLKSAWDAAGNTAPPSLFGQPFMLLTSPNRFGLPDYYALHAWIGKYNPSGMFSMWNPAVSCTGNSTNQPGPGDTRHDGECDSFGNPHGRDDTGDFAPAEPEDRWTRSQGSRDY